MGDDIRSEIINEKSLLMANHQSTSDVLLIMAALDGYSSRHMWIMDRRFLKTHVGLVSWFHKDFFIRPVLNEIEYIDIYKRIAYCTM